VLPWSMSTVWKYLTISASDKIDFRPREISYIVMLLDLSLSKKAKRCSREMSFLIK
jgi:hypothetical protein